MKQDNKIIEKVLKEYNNEGFRMQFDMAHHMLKALIKITLKLRDEEHLKLKEGYIKEWNRLNQINKKQREDELKFLKEVKDHFENGPLHKFIDNRIKELKEQGK